MDGRAEALYQALLAAYGPCGWWPADSRFEIVAGAILVQRTAWRNAALALERLRAAELLQPARLAAVDTDALQTLVRPAGFYRAKSARLKNIADWLCSHGGFAALDQWSDASLRSALLALPGIGEETADVILVYAFERAVFVADAYARRLFSRLGWCPNDVRYGDLSRAVGTALKPDPAVMNEFHALIVTHAQNVCRSQPRCAACCVQSLCRTAGDALN